MKINKVTTALVGLGLVSLASAAQANTVVYLTGSTAARAIIYAAATTSGQIFSGTSTVVAGTNANSSSQIVYEGNITGVGTVDISCDFTGSEAGIASVAGTALPQTLPNDPNGQGPYSLPGVGTAALYYQPNGSGGWNAPAALAAGASADGNAFPDLSMADTSQAVSVTPNAGSTALVDYGVVGIVPFTFMKGYESSPDGPYTHLSNVTTADINEALSLGDNLSAFYFTGNTNDLDSVDGIAIVGRNLGSGTRVNTLLNAASYPVGQTVNQFALNSSYPTGTPGTLTFGNYTTPATETFVGNDGFDSGGSVQTDLNVDGSGVGDVIVGYVGISDAKNAVVDHNGGTGSGDAVFLTFNGVYEGDEAVETGQYPFWGQEHLLGQHGQSSTGAAGETASAIVSGIGAQLTSSGAGLATGSVNGNAANQSLVIPSSLMRVKRSLDYGFPVLK